MEVVRLTEKGLYCPAGNFYIDPWLPVEKAVITHGHGDHARTGNAAYFCAQKSVEILKQRVGETSVIEGFAYKKSIKLGSVTLSFHPAGHILGSSQIRIEQDRHVLVVSGDYKRDPDPTCEEFEVVPCDTFITEATFGLPIYQWPKASLVAQDILRWWNKNAATKKASVLFCYSLGKAQRILAELALITNRPVFIHGAVKSLTELYRKEGIPMLETQLVSEAAQGQKYAGELILAPPSAEGSVWMRRFGEYETAFASGWMRVRGARRWKSYDRGFVISDHADWQSLIRTIKETQAQKILVTHGKTHNLVKYLNDELGLNAKNLETHFGEEGAD